MAQQLLRGRERGQGKKIPHLHGLAFVEVAQIPESFVTVLLVREWRLFLTSGKEERSDDASLTLLLRAEVSGQQLEHLRLNLPHIDCQWRNCLTRRK